MSDTAWPTRDDGQNARRPIMTVNAYHVDDIKADGHAGAPIGQVDLFNDGALQIAEANPEELAFLRATLDRINAKSELPVKRGQPGEARARTVRRGEAGFIEAMRAYLESYYGLRLG